MINAIIFSKDRAMQLRLLLESMFLRTYKILDEITVIYTSSEAEFAQGYSLLQKENLIPRIKINWIQEKNLGDDVLTTLQKYARGQKAFTVFFTDDSVFYENIHDYKFSIESCLYPGSDIGCFSLRMGVNTTEETYWRPGNSRQLQYVQVGNLLKWRHTDYPMTHGYGYPLSLDGHIFRASDILGLVQQVLPISGVNYLEAQLSQFKFELAPCMASFQKSVLVTVPINRVQDAFPNQAGIFHPISAKELNRRYLNGEVIDYYSIDFSSINSTHQELKFGFRRKQ
jgi:hypothetical protein